MEPSGTLDLLYRFFGDAAIASMITFLLLRVAGTRTGGIAGQVMAALRDGKITADELQQIRLIVGGSDVESD